MASPPLRELVIAALLDNKDSLLGEDSEERIKKLKEISPIFALLCDEESKSAVQSFAGSAAGPLVDGISGCIVFAETHATSARQAFAPPAQ